MRKGGAYLSPNERTEKRVAVRYLPSVHCYLLLNLKTGYLAD
jgi:hypothetical protein